MKNYITYAKRDAIIEFAKRLREKSFRYNEHCRNEVVWAEDIDRLENIARRDCNDKCRNV